MQVVIAILLVLLSSAGTYAQTEVSTEQVSKPVSQEDLEKAAAAMRRSTREAVKEVAEKSAAQLAEERRLADERQKVLLDQVKANEQARADAEQAQADRQKVLEESSARTIKMIYGVGGIAIVALAILVVVFARTRSKPVEVEVRRAPKREEPVFTPPAPTPIIPKNDVLRNPSLEVLNNLFAKDSKPEKSRIPFTLVLEKPQAEFQCEAEYRAGLDLLIHFLGEKDVRPATWKQRNVAAKKITENRVSTSATPPGVSVDSPNSAHKFH